MLNLKKEEKKLLLSFIPGLCLCLAMFIVKCVEVYFKIDFTNYGVFPRSIDGTIGIFTMPLIHDDWQHLISNLVPVFILFAIMIHFYHEAAYRIVVFIWIFHGIWLWIGGRPSYHIGASGLVYGLATFILLSGFIRKEKSVLALSFLVIFLYGGLVWGIFPLIKQMSWEAHLFGVLAGIIMAYYYRNIGPQLKVYNWDDDDQYNYTVDDEGNIIFDNSNPNEELEPKPSTPQTNHEQN